MVWSTIQTNHLVINVVHIRWKHLINVEMIVVEFRRHLFWILSSWISKSQLYLGPVFPLSELRCTNRLLVFVLLCKASMGWIPWFVVRLGILCILDWPSRLILSPIVNLQSTAHGGEPVKPLPHNKIIEIKQKTMLEKKKKKNLNHMEQLQRTQNYFFFLLIIR